MRDENQVRLTGAVDRTKRITTRTGNPMAEIILRVLQDRFRITSHGNLAEELLDHLKPGDRLTISGSLSVSNWKDEASGEWRNSFSISAWAAELQTGEQLCYRRQDKQASTTRRRDELPMASPNDPF